MITYEKTDDVNIIKEVRTVIKEIRIDDIETDIAKLQSQLDNMPMPKTEPDQETLAYYNGNIEMEFRKEDIKTVLKEKQDLLKELISLKVKMM